MAKTQYDADSITVLKAWRRSANAPVCISEVWEQKASII